MNNDEYELKIDILINININANLKLGKNGSYAMSLNWLAHIAISIRIKWKFAPGCIVCDFQYQKSQITAFVGNLKLSCYHNRCHNRFPIPPLASGPCQHKFTIVAFQDSPFYLPFHIFYLCLWICHASKIYVRYINFHEQELWNLWHAFDMLTQGAHLGRDFLHLD